jgi:hypothetical protein
MEKLSLSKPLKRNLNMISTKNMNKADDDFKTSYINNGIESGEMKLLIRIRQAMDSSLPKDVVTLQNFVTGYKTFRKYYGTQFSQGQYKNNCTATLTANVLSYYKTARGVNLYSKRITQDLYDLICSDIDYSTLVASNLLNVIKGLKTIAQREDKVCIFRKYRYNFWSDITWDINDDKIIMLGYKSHAYLILGYRIINGVNQVYTFTGWSYLPYKWVDYNPFMSMVSVYIY